MFYYADFQKIRDIANEFDAAVSIYDYKSIFHYKLKNPNARLDVVSSIDFENIFKRAVFADVIETQKLLAKNGFFLFSYDENKLAITTDSVVPISPSENGKMLINHLGNKK